MKEQIREKLQRVITLFMQPSTWRGLVVVLTGAGVGMKPEHTEAIVAGGLVVAGLIAIFIEE